MPIALAPLNQEVTIARVACDPKEISHLAAMGLARNVKVTVLSSIKGAVVISLRGSRLALDRDIAARIFVA